MAIIATWQLNVSTMCSSDCEARSMATKRQRVSTRSSDSSVADKEKIWQVSAATVTVVVALYDGRARSIVTADCSSIWSLNVAYSVGT